MTTLTVIYSRNHHLGSYLIRVASWFGPWSHSAVITAEGTVIEARGLTGVREVPMVEFMGRATQSEVVWIECPDPAAAVAFAREQIGKRYDFGAILGFITRRNWADRQCWECTELVEAALVAGGRERWRERVYRIHPTMSYNAR